MLKAITIENFKAFGKEVRIPLNNITLLFGPNSSGKSSVIQALQYAHEIFNRGILDPISGQKSWGNRDFGGFVNLLHNREKHRPMTLKFEFDLDYMDYATTDVEGKNNLYRGFHPIGLPSEPYTAEPSLIGEYINYSQSDSWLRLIIYWDDKANKAVIKHFDLGINGQKLAEVRYKDESAALTYFFFHHPLFILKKPSREDLVNLWEQMKGAEPQPRQPIFRNRMKELAIKVLQSEYLENGLLQKPLYFSEGSPRKSPMLDQDFLLSDGNFRNYTVDLADWMLAKEEGSEKSYLENPHEKQQSTLSRNYERILFIKLIEVLMINPIRYVQKALEEMVHLGPFRDAPERSSIPPISINYLNLDRATDAWDLLYFMTDDSINILNNYLERLKIDYRIVVKHYKEVSATSSRRRKREKQAEGLDMKRVYLEDGSGNILELIDVGMGIAQIFPIIIRAIQTIASYRHISIEQPELHIHPALQAELGDLFLVSSLNLNRKFLIETHSEHLILRLMRRMRETANNNLPDGVPSVTPADVSILYVQPTEVGAVVRVLELDAEGQLLDPWPGGFFEEGFRERFS